jgi:hypothetical protein
LAVNEPRDCKGDPAVLRLLCDALERCDEETAREVIAEAAKTIGWDPVELLGLDVDELRG